MARLALQLRCRWQLSRGSGDAPARAQRGGARDSNGEVAVKGMGLHGYGSKRKLLQTTVFADFFLLPIANRLLKG